MISCSSEQQVQDYSFQIKTLEYSRNKIPANWNDLYSQLPNDIQKILLVDAAAKTQNSSLIPFLQYVLNLQPSDSLLKKVIFALGQTKSTEAEQMLLALPFDSLSNTLRASLISSLGQCCSERALPFLKTLINFNLTSNEALKTLALCRRKNIGKNYFPEDSSAATAYYLNYASSFKDIPYMIELLQNNDALAKKYLLKALYKKSILDSSRFKRWLGADSLSSQILKTNLKIILSDNYSWWEKLYAIQLVPLLNDSVLNKTLLPYQTSKIPHLRIAAIESFLQTVDNYEAVSFLLSLLSDEKNPFLRGHMLKLLATADSQSAYRIIMQDLDRGDDRYKASLLDALAVTGLKSAIRTLRQFVHVPSPQLSNCAFENLKQLGLIRNKELDIMLASGSFSSVSIALEWANDKNKKIPHNTLLNMYRAFNRPNQFEAQKSVLKFLARNISEPDSGLKKLLMAESGHPFLQAEMSSFFPQVSWEQFHTFNYLDFLPGFLQRDSLKHYDKNPVALIQTTRGDIKIELFADHAPLTVQNFLHLAGTGFYKNLSFHRVIADFVIQGGDPGGDGWGGTDYLLPSEDNEIPFKRGSVGIATSGFDTGSCQFFICHSEQPHLTGNYTNFAHVIEGINIVDQILPGDKIKNILILPEESL